MSLHVQKIVSDKLSHYRTSNVFIRYAECKSVADFVEASKWAQDNKVPLFVLGNGSNVLFCAKTVKALVVKNMLPCTIEETGARELVVSSATPVARVIKWCLERNLDSFYYLASVPATIGGAVAMNAGRGIAHNQTILDFVTSVSYVENGREVTAAVSEIKLGYRQTIFTGVHSRLITKVVFQFPPAVLKGNPAHERVAWSKEHQDYTAPNCGSVFRRSNGRIMRMLRGVSFGKAAYSRKTSNWLLYRGGTGLGLRVLILAAQVIHVVTRRRCELEIIRVR